MKLINSVICKVFGHRSTGNMLWWCCDRCGEDFRSEALPSTWTKVTRSPNMFGK